VAPGEFATLAVRDTGCGMDAVTRAHVFEPFFTTKGPGLGTGLGLATVYGIVRQNGGFIEVQSEPGRGTDMTLWLPRSREAGDADAAAVALPALRGTETILLVEDEEQVLTLTRRVLERHGYTVLAAASPEAALTALTGHRASVALLITDVVMPGMNGRLLCQQVHAVRPDVRCLFVSGYTADIIAHQGVGDSGVRLLQKPFAPNDLLRAVREILDAP
jgi:CheY-like chemotaxis protein